MTVRARSSREAAQAALGLGPPGPGRRRRQAGRHRRRRGHPPGRRRRGEGHPDGRPVMTARRRDAGTASGAAAPSKERARPAARGAAQRPALGDGARRRRGVDRSSGRSTKGNNTLELVGRGPHRPAQRPDRLPRLRARRAATPTRSSSSPPTSAEIFRNVFAWLQGIFSVPDFPRPVPADRLARRRPPSPSGSAWPSPAGASRCWSAAVFVAFGLLGFWSDSIDLLLVTGMSVVFVRAHRDPARRARRHQPTGAETGSSRRSWT